MNRPFAQGLDFVIGASGQDVDADYFHILGGDDGTDGERQSVVIGIRLRGVKGVAHVEEAFVEALFVVDTIGSYTR